MRSSIARRLGMDIGALAPSDRHTEGVVEMMLDATQKYAEPLSDERLFAWHAALFPTGRSGMTKIIVGAWRDNGSAPMQVVSGPIGRERVHYEAPAAPRLEAEMAAFLEWFNAEAVLDPVLKAALAHVWFVTIHPFDDGNGRIARAIADMLLARSEQSAQRFYSMSAQIRLERTAYYDILEATQKGDLDVTVWLEWFLGCLDRAIAGATQTLSGVLRKARFWEAIKGQPLNERQRKSSTDCWKASRASSPRPNGRLSRSHRLTRPCATLPILSNGASSFVTLVADAARATRWPGWGRGNRREKGQKTGYEIMAFTG